MHVRGFYYKFDIISYGKIRGNITKYQDSTALKPVKMIKATQVTFLKSETIQTIHLTTHKEQT